MALMGPLLVLYCSAALAVRGEAPEHRGHLDDRHRVHPQRLLDGRRLAAGARPGRPAPPSPGRAGRTGSRRARRHPAARRLGVGHDPQAPSWAITMTYGAPKRSAVSTSVKVNPAAPSPERSRTGRSGRPAARRPPHRRPSPPRRWPRRSSSAPGADQRATGAPSGRCSRRPGGTSRRARERGGSPGRCGGPAWGTRRRGRGRHSPP